MGWADLGRYFTDPVLQAPTLASMLMCASSALIGVIVFLRRRSLLGEALSHAAYPGVIASALLCSFFSSFDLLMPFALFGAFLSALLGQYVIDRLEGRFSVKEDAALCFVLAFFFGVGVLLASRMQVTHALFYKAVQLFLYGQVATMMGIHVWMYLLLTCLVGATLILFFHPIRVVMFDKTFSRSIGVPSVGIGGLLSTLLALAIVVGIRSVGVVLMAGMLIAPAIAARQWTERLERVFIYAALMGAASGFLGNYFSLEIPSWISGGGNESFVLPTGPMILLVSVVFCLFSLLFAPQRGVCGRYVRVYRFKRKCAEEHVLKYLWKKGEGGRVSTGELVASRLGSPWHVFWLLLRLKRSGWLLEDDKKHVSLTKEGRVKAGRVVRLHRLWEAYLVFLGQGVEKVHRSAEEMEHILTPDLERQLAEVLGHPKRDPHAQPIPSEEERR